MRLATLAGEYWQNIRQFTPAARSALVIFGALGVAYGVFTTLFTVYLLAIGFDERFIGVLTAVGTLSGALASLPAGIIYDRYGPRLVLLLGLTMTALGVAVECLLTQAGLLLIGGALAAVGVSLLLIAQAPLLAAVSSDQERTHLYSAAAALGILASVIGNAYAGFLPDVLVRWQEAAALRYRLTLLTGCLPAIAAFWFVPRLKLSAGVGERPRIRVRECLDHSAVRRLIFTGVLLAAGGGLVLPFLNVFFVSEYGVGSREVAVVRTVGIVATAVGALAAPLLATRFGLVLGIVIGRASSAPWLLAAGLAPTWWLAAAAYALRTFCVYCSDPLHTDYSMRIVPASLRATVNSLTFLSWNVSLAAAGWAGGQVASVWGYPSLFSWGTVLTLVAAVTFWLVFRSYSMPSFSTASDSR